MVELLAQRLSVRALLVQVLLAQVLVIGGLVLEFSEIRLLLVKLVIQFMWVKVSAFIVLVIEVEAILRELQQSLTSLRLFMAGILVVTLTKVMVEVMIEIKVEFKVEVLRLVPLRLRAEILVRVLLISLLLQRTTLILMAITPIQSSTFPLLYSRLILFQVKLDLDYFQQWYVRVVLTLFGLLLEQYPLLFQGHSLELFHSQSQPKLFILPQLLLSMLPPPPPSLIPILVLPFLTQFTHSQPISLHSLPLGLRESQSVATLILSQPQVLSLLASLPHHLPSLPLQFAHMFPLQFSPQLHCSPPDRLMAVSFIPSSLIDTRQPPTSLPILPLSAPVSPSLTQLQPPLIAVYLILALPGLAGYPRCHSFQIIIKYPYSKSLRTRFQTDYKPIYYSNPPISPLITFNNPHPPMKSIYIKAFNSISSRLLNNNTPQSIFASAKASSHIYNLFPRFYLINMLKTPCPIRSLSDSQKPYETIQIGKNLRAALDINEGKVCGACELKTKCRVSFETGNNETTQNALFDLYQYLERLSDQSLELEQKVYASGLTVLLSFPGIVETMKSEEDLIGVIQKQNQQMMVQRLKRREQETGLKVGEKGLNQDTEISETMNPLEHYRQQRYKVNMEKNMKSWGKQVKEQFKPWGDIETGTKVIKRKRRVRQVEEKMEDTQPRVVSERPRNYNPQTRNFKQTMQKRFYGQERLKWQQKQDRASRDSKPRGDNQFG